MGRPKLPAAERTNREKVGEILRGLRQRQALSLEGVCRSLGDDVTRARLWGIEKGNLPYSGLLFQLCSLYSESPESIIERATGQSSLNLLGSFFLHPGGPKLDMRRVVISMTTEEEDLVKGYLDWLRYRLVMAGR